jgi:cell division protease FtsH
MIFLGREISEQRNYSDDVARQIDEEVRNIIETAYARAQDVLTRHRDKLDKLAETLVEKETLDSEDFEALFSDLPPKAPLHGVVPKLVGAPAHPA